MAFHPSGLHIAVAVTAEIHMCNVLANELEVYKTLPIKQCSEIKFAHGGHMFACVQQQKDICVYQFLTNDCQPQMMFVGHHTHRVRCIDWFENDFGFISCCMGGFIFFYDLFQYAKQKSSTTGQRIIDRDINKKDVKFTSVVNIPGKPYEVLAVGSDRTFTSNEPIKKGEKPLLPPVLPAILS